MTTGSLSINLATPEATSRLARRLGAGLGPGDCLLLSGPIGAGKTHFARALITSLLAEPEDVPSPTFTLVQTYESAEGTEIWHADLYRLTAVDEVLELGLDDAWRSGICLIEWPDRLGSLAPRDALGLFFHSDSRHPESRWLEGRWTAPKWNAVLEDLCSD